MIVRVVIPIAPNIRDYLDTVAREWGGYTRTTFGTGGWLDHRGRVIDEPIIILDIWVGDDTPICRRWWIAFANKIRRDLDQDSVYLQFSAAEVLFVGADQQVLDEEAGEE